MWIAVAAFASVLAAFMTHWLTIAAIGSAEKRLPYCRGAYLGMSLQLAVLAWTLAALSDGASGAAILVPLGMTASSLGDLFNLQFPSIQKRVGQPLFFGILCFAVAQVFYIAAFLSRLSLSVLVSDGFFVPILAVLVVVPAVLFRFRVYNPERPASIMRAAFFYGFILGAMAAVAVSAAIAVGGPWYVVAAGALSFLLSDAIMGETTMHGRHPTNEYQVPWITYLLAQGLIIIGTALA